MKACSANGKVIGMDIFGAVVVNVAYTTGTLAFPTAFREKKLFSGYFHQPKDKS